jgi:dihydrofolate reductase
MPHSHPEIILILARADNGVIGRDGALPWHIPNDLRHFKRLTMGLPMIMGRKTFDSLPGLLEGRRHIVLTRDPDWAEDGAESVHSIEDALKHANAPHVAVIGGAEIFAAFLPMADRIEMTHVALSPDGDAHVALPDPAAWELVNEEAHDAEGHSPAYRFATYKRRSETA